MFYKVNTELLNTDQCFQGKQKVGFLRASDRSQAPSPVLTPLCAPNRNRAPWGPLLHPPQPQPHNLPAGPSLCPLGGRAENQNWPLPPPFRTWPEACAHSLCGAGVHESGTLAGWSGLRDPQGSHQRSQAPHLKPCLTPSLKTLKSQRGWLKVKSPHPWGSSCPHHPPSTPSLLPPFPSQPDPSHPPGLKI